MTTAPQRRVGQFTLDSWEATTAKPLLVAAFAFLVVLTVPVIDTHLDDQLRALIRVLDVGIWLVFAVDYLMRLYLAPQRWHFVRTHIPDLAMVALPAVRPLRILRLLSLGDLLAKRSANTLLANTGVAVVGTAVLIVYLGAVGVLDAERDASKANITSFGDAVWWACSTITTVGYGDRYPVTVLGRLIAVGLMIVGIALLGILTAGIAAWFVRQSTLAATTEAAEAVIGAVEEAAEAEEAGQRVLSNELEELVQAVEALDAKLRSLAGRANVT